MLTIPDCCFWITSAQVVARPKDHMKEAGDVCFADVLKDGTGVMEFLCSDDIKYGIKKLNDSRSRSHEDEVAYTCVRGDNDQVY